MVDHELRNPLSALQNAVAVSREAEGADKRAMLEVIARNAGQMRRLVDDLVDLARMRAGHLSIERRPRDMCRLVRDSAEDHLPTARTRGIELELVIPDTPLIALVDGPRIRQVLSNLIGNAFRATPRGGRITLSLEQQGEDLLLVVGDSGIGIRAEDLAAIFGAFERRTPSEDTDGLGLGLTIARSLVELHGGTLTAESEGPGSGARFLIRLPAAMDIEEETPEPVAAPAKRHRIVLIDDHRDHADVFAILLRRHGHEVAVAYDGTDGIEAVKSFRPSVVLVDIGLPGMTGLDVARALRNQAGGDQLLLFAHTGYADHATIQSALAAGFDAHLAKPVKVEEFERALTRAAGEAVDEVGAAEGSP